jgi:large conductance mechanosensitive channel
VAWILFFVIKGMNTLKRAAQDAEPPPPAPETPADVVLLGEIRDLLARRA